MVCLLFKISSDDPPISQQRDLCFTVSVRPKLAGSHTTISRSAQRNTLAILILIIRYVGLQVQLRASGHQSQLDVVSLPVERRKFVHDHSFVAG